VLRDVKVPMANFSAENIYESKRWDMYVFLVCFVIINFFLVQKNIFFFNLIYNESDTEKLNFEFYYNDINRCNMQYCILFSEFYFLCTYIALQDAYILYLFFFRFNLAIQVISTLTYWTTLLKLLLPVSFNQSA